MALEPFCAPPDHVVKEGVDTRISDLGIIGYRGPRQPRRPAWQFWKPYQWRNHMPARHIRRNLGAAMFDGYTKITAIRNPFDRAVLQFYFRPENRPAQGEDFASIRKRFREYVLTQRWGTDARIVTIGDKVVMDLAVRKERMREDLDNIAGRLGLDRDRIQLPHTKSQKAVRGAYKVAEYFDPDTIEAVKTRMAWVFDNFEYPPTPDGSA